MKRLLYISICIATLLSMASCEAVRSFIHDGEVVAKVGNHKLYRSDLDEQMPRGLSPEDSIALAEQQINAWAMEQLFIDMADAQLSKEEKDVSGELEAYRRSLLRYRYEQRYVNERLDTVITDSEIERYYETHQDMFKLEFPILKARYVDIMQDSPNMDVIRKKMSSDTFEDLAEVDSLAYASAIKYLDWSDKWVESVTLAREFDTDYASMLAGIKNSYIESKQERGDVKIAYIIDVQKSGSLAPLDYCESRIRNIILSNRKHAILSTLEQDLLDDALSKNKIERNK